MPGLDDTDTDVQLIDEAVLERMASEGAFAANSDSGDRKCGDLGDGHSVVPRSAGGGIASKMEDARGFQGAELELPFSKPAKFDLLWIAFTSFQACVVPIINIVLVAHFAPSEYMESAPYTGKTFGFFFMLLSPLVMYAVSAAMNIEYVCRRYLYYRLMEQGYLVDFKNPQITESWLLWGTGLYFLIMFRIAQDEIFAVFMNCFSLVMCWYATMQFENTLVSINKFVESKDGKFDRDSFRRSAEFLAKLNYISESRLERNALAPLPKPTNTEGKYDIVAIAAPAKDLKLPKATGLDIIYHKAFVYRYIAMRRENFVDEQDRKFAELAQYSAQGAVAFGVGLFLYLFIVGLFF